MDLVLDVETNGLLWELDRIHSLVLRDVNTGEVYSCADQEGYLSIHHGLKLIEKAKKLIMHNGINFDLRAIKKVYPGFCVQPECEIVDTLILSRVLSPELEPVDDQKFSHIDKKYRGRHSLAAWGERLGVAKIKFQENKKKDPDVDNVWAHWSPEMQTYCMAGHHKFLREDLRWVRCEDINVGDIILGFDEHAANQGRRGRNWRPATVLGKKTDEQELFRVTLESGKTFDVTAEHRWLVNALLSREEARQANVPPHRRDNLMWVETKDLMKRKCRALKYFDTWEDLNTYEAGYLAGIFDGEGCIYKNRIDYSFAQKPGMVLDKACEILQKLGCTYTARKVIELEGTDCIRLTGDCYKKLKLLGTIRPERLIGNIRPFECLGRCEIKGDGFKDLVVSVESIGIGKIYKISTSTGTFILDGYAHHNCVGDTLVTKELYEYFLAQELDPRCHKLEHDFARVMSFQEDFGFPFNEKAAFALVNTLKARRGELDDQLQEIFPPISEERISPKTGRKLKTKITTFNAGSRQQIADRLQERYPEITFGATEKGNVKLDDDVLAILGEKYPEAKVLAEYQLLNKRLGQIADGKESWLKHCQRYGDGRIHGGVKTNACVSGRCSHVSPNMAQVPSVGHAYGAECRALFTAPEGWLLVGTDAAGLELRALGAWLAHFDGGEYAKLVSTDGFDVHTYNARLFGIYDGNGEIKKTTRDLSKRLIYALLYGAGAKKVGSVVDIALDEQEQYTIGKKTIDTFYKNLPAIKKLKDKIDERITTRGYLVGIDGRRLQIRSKHSALNQLLQSTGAVVMKKATCIFYADIENKGLLHGIDYGLCANVHDELQIATKPEYVEIVQQLSTRSIEKAGVFFNLLCPFTGESKAGKNWMETH